MNPPMTLWNGVKVMTDPFMLEDGEPYEVDRTWKERLFTFRPWRPLKKTRTVVPRVPMKSVIKIGGEAIVMHPAIFEEFKKALDNQDSHS
jgi:hypothetical protein